MSQFSNFTIRQIKVISQMSEATGVRDLARKNSMDPAAVSRLIKEVETTFGITIIKRTKTGFILTNEGRVLVDQALALIKQITEFENLKPLDPSFSKIPSFSLASRSFLNALLAEILTATQVETLGFKLKFLDGSPVEVLRACLSNSIEMAVHLEEWALPNSWLTHEVSTLTWALIASYKHPLKEKSSLKQVQKFPFVAASSLVNDKVERATDIFPLKWNERRIGHESQTASTSKAIIMSSQHIAFLPLITVKDEIEAKKLKIINVTDMNPVQMKVYFSLNQNNVTKKVEQHLLEAFQKLKEFDSLLSESLGKNNFPDVQSKFARISL